MKRQKTNQTRQIILAFALIISVVCFFFERQADGTRAQTNSESKTAENSDAKLMMSRRFESLTQKKSGANFSTNTRSDLSASSDGDGEAVTSGTKNNDFLDEAGLVQPSGAAGILGKAPVDMNGDGKTDYVVVRNTGGGPSGQVTWFIQNNGVAGQSAAPWGIASDFFVPEDYDGDGKDDIAVWRPGPATQAAFYILQSQTNTVRIDAFGQNRDDPTIVGDYDGDNKADVAVYRPGTAASPQGAWLYRGSLNNPNRNVTSVGWGTVGDIVAPGDYDGDGKNDLCTQRNLGTGAAIFYLLKSQSSTVEYVYFGRATDIVVPGDYDNDGKTDFGLVRAASGQFNWYILTRAGGGTGANPIVFGSSAVDFPVQGDYDGDGKTDVGVWRSVTGTFWILKSSDNQHFAFPFGQNGDYPAANYNAH